MAAGSGELHVEQCCGAAPAGVKLPQGWSYSPSKKTWSGLKEERRKGNIPDISFDLDGDGMVGGQDLVLGKLFDKDGDGRLNTAERQSAEAALGSGAANQFLWGVERSAPTRPFRIIQKRGKVIDCEDFSPIAETYQRMRSQSPVVRTAGELRESRAKERLNTLQGQRERWEAAHPQVIKIEGKDRAQGSLPYRSWTEKKDLEHRSARTKVGLTAVSTDISPKPSPTLAYIHSPQHRSKSQMHATKQVEKLSDLNTKQNFSYLDAEKRLNLRESMAKGEKTESKTYAEVIEKMKREANAHNLATFSNVVVGVHGHELPKFAEDFPEYWKLRPGYNPAPKVTSQIEWNQNKKIWAKRDVYRLADKDSEPPPCDAFKAVHTAVVKSEEIPLPPNRCVPAVYDKVEPADNLGKEKDMEKYRWTSKVEKFVEARRVKREQKAEKDTSQMREAEVALATVATSQPTTQVTSRKWTDAAGSSRKITKTMSPSLVRSTGFLNH